MKSIKSYLIYWVLGIVITGVLLISYISYQATKEEIEELFDAELITTAKMFFRFMHLKGRQDKNKVPEKQSNMVFDLSNTFASELDNTMPSHEYEGKIAFIIYDDNYNKLAESVNSPKYLPQALQEGFANKTLDGQKWHFFILYEKNRKLWLVTAQHDAIRQELIQKILSFLILPSIIGIPILVFLIWFFFR